MTSSIDCNHLASLVRDAACEVFSTMMGLELHTADYAAHSAGYYKGLGAGYYLDTCPPARDEGVLALIGFAGDWNGAGTLSCGSEAARRLAGALLLQEFATVDDEVLDALGELANMIFGTVKTRLEEQFGVMGLSVPTVIQGSNLTARSVGNRQWLVLSLASNGAAFELRICLAPNRKLHFSGRIPAALAVAD